MSLNDIRLKKEKDFSLVFNKGKRLYSDNITLLLLQSKELKVGYAVGKKHGTSVKRNRIKRLLRESFRKYLPKIKGEYYLVFIPKVKEEYFLDEFCADMEKLLVKGGLIDA